MTPRQVVVIALLVVLIVAMLWAGWMAGELAEMVRSDG